MKDRCVHRAARGTDRERPRRVAEELNDRKRRPAERGAEVVGVERPHIGATDAWCRELRIAGPVLAAVRPGHERPIPAAAGEHDVARLVADEQRPRHPRQCRGRRIDLDDADAVREVIHHPDFGPCRAVRSCRDGDGLEADLHLRRERQPGGGDRVNLETVVRRIDGEQLARVRRERERADMTALEVDERAGGGDLRDEHHPDTKGATEETAHETPRNVEGVRHS